VPIHYSTDVMPIFTGDPEEFQEHLSKLALDTVVHVMEPGDELSS
jgi:L-ascorbate metabolism protein UlaG (beta-lactamase superfamily)